MAEVIKRTLTDSDVLKMEAPKKRTLTDADMAKMDSSNDSPSLASSAGKAAAGFGIGMAENFNPLNIPRGLEVLGRAAGKYVAKKSLGEDSGILDALDEATQEAKMPDLSLRRVAPYARAGVEKLYEERDSLLPGAPEARSFDELLKQNQGAQESFQGDPIVGGSQTVGELTGVGVGLGQTAANVAKATKLVPKLNGLVDKLAKLKGSRILLEDPSMPGISPKVFKESQELQRQLLGDLAPELRESLFNRTQDVKRMLDGPPESRSVMSTVQTLRDQTKLNKELIGESIKEFRYAITSDSPMSFDTTYASKYLQDFQKNARFSGGMTSLDPKDSSAINNFSVILKNPSRGRNSNQFTTRDATVFVDKIDDFLNKQGYYEGKNITKTNQAIFSLREAVDSELATMYPSYKSTKGLYSDFVKDYQQVQSKIEGMGAESFVANLFGRNKTEQRILVDRLMDKGNETLDAFRTAVKDSDNISSSNQSYNNSVVNLRDKVKDISFKEGKDLMNEIADKAMARRLAEVSDKDADVVRNLVNQYVQSEVELAAKKVTRAGALATGPSALVGGFLARALEADLSASATVGAGSGFMGNQIAQGLVGKLQGNVRAKAMNRAEYLFSVQRLFDQVSKSKAVSPETSKFATGVNFIFNKFGPDAAEAFLNKANLTMKFQNDFEKVLSGVGGVQGILNSRKDKKGLAGNIPEPAKRSFAGDVLRGKKQVVEFPPTEVKANKPGSK